MGASAAATARKGLDCPVRVRAGVCMTQKYHNALSDRLSSACLARGRSYTVSPTALVENCDLWHRCDITNQQDRSMTSIAVLRRELVRKIPCVGEYTTHENRMNSFARSSRAVTATGSWTLDPRLLNRTILHLHGILQSLIFLQHQNHH